MYRGRRDTPIAFSVAHIRGGDGARAYLLLAATGRIPFVFAVRVSESLTLCWWVRVRARSRYHRRRRPLSLPDERTLPFGLPPPQQPKRNARASGRACVRPHNCVPVVRVRAPTCVLYVNACVRASRSQSPPPLPPP